MRVDVVLPQMGESIAEGTITRWIKQLGESIEKDEPLFELSTDKVDAEIPSPTATGTAVGSGGTILRTTDGGSSWVGQTSGTTNWLYGVSFTDP